MAVTEGRQALKKYYGTFIFKVTMKDEEVAQSVDKIVGEIEKLGGKLEEKMNMGTRPYARLLKKQDTGTYVTVRYELEPGQMAALDHRLKLIEEIFRFQLLNAQVIPEPKVVKAAPVVEPVAG